MCQIIKTSGPSHTRGTHFWCRKVFEGVHNHVLNLLRKRTFGAEYYIGKEIKIHRCVLKVLNFSRILTFWHGDSDVGDIVMLVTYAGYHFKMLLTKKVCW